MRGLQSWTLRDLVRLVDDWLGVSRITHDRLQLRREPVDLAEIPVIATATAQPLRSSASQTLEVQLTEAALPLHADPHRLAEVFSNPLSVASKFSVVGGPSGLWQNCSHSVSLCVCVTRASG